MEGRGSRRPPAQRSPLSCSLEAEDPAPTPPGPSSEGGSPEPEGDGAAPAEGEAEAEGEAVLMEEDLIQQSLDDYDAGKYSPRLLSAHELPLDAHVLEPDEDLQRLHLSRQQLQVTGAYSGGRGRGGRGQREGRGTPCQGYARSGGEAGRGSAPRVLMGDSFNHSFGHSDLLPEGQGGGVTARVQPCCEFILLLTSGRLGLLGPIILGLQKWPQKGPGLGSPCGSLISRLPSHSAGGTWCLVPKEHSDHRRPGQVARGGWGLPSWHLAPGPQLL